jgi:hypothetical protein
MFAKSFASFAFLLSRWGRQKLRSIWARLAFLRSAQLHHDSTFIDWTVRCCPGSWRGCPAAAPLHQSACLLLPRPGLCCVGAMTGVQWGCNERKEVIHPLQAMLSRAFFPTRALQSPLLRSVPSNVSASEALCSLWSLTGKNVESPGRIASASSGRSAEALSLFRRPTWLNPS